MNLWIKKLLEELLATLHKDLLPLKWDQHYVTNIMHHTTKVIGPKIKLPEGYPSIGRKDKRSSVSFIPIFNTWRQPITHTEIYLDLDSSLDKRKTLDNWAAIIRIAHAGTLSAQAASNCQANYEAMLIGVAKQFYESFKRSRR